jgi:carbon starvation protein
VTAGPGGYQMFWTLFGTSNQLLAALTLLAVTVWLQQKGKRYWFTLAPMLFLMTMTLWSLAGQSVQFTRGFLAAPSAASAVPQLANATVAVLLFALTAFLVYEAIRAVSRPRPSGPLARSTMS